jgi:hypothetical protein
MLLFRNLINPLNPSGHYVPAIFRVCKAVFYIYGFCVILTVNSDYFLKQHQSADLCNGDVCCSLWGTDWIIKYYLDQLRIQMVKLNPLYKIFVTVIGCSLRSTDSILKYYAHDLWLQRVKTNKISQCSRPVVAYAFCGLYSLLIAPFMTEKLSFSITVTFLLLCRKIYSITQDAGQNY